MIARADESDLVRLDLNNAVFQRQLFALEKTQQLGVLATCGNSQSYAGRRCTRIEA